MRGQISSDVRCVATIFSSWRCFRCHDLAIKTFRYAIQLEPNFPDAYNNLGNALRESGQLEVGRGTRADRYCRGKSWVLACRLLFLLSVLYCTEYLWLQNDGCFLLLRTCGVYVCVCFAACVSLLLVVRCSACMYVWSDCFKVLICSCSMPP